MIKFYLKTKKGTKETISHVFTESLEEALRLFSLRKKLKPEDLLKIYIITE